MLSSSKEARAVSLEDIAHFNSLKPVWQVMLRKQYGGEGGGWQEKDDATQEVGFGTHRDS